MTGAEPAVTNRKYSRLRYLAHHIWILFFGVGAGGAFDGKIAAPIGFAMLGLLSLGLMIEDGLGAHQLLGNKR